MKQVKEEADKGKQSEMRRNKEVAQLRKEQLRKENRIRNLEKESKQRDLVLKRKQEEVSSMWDLVLKCKTWGHGPPI